MGKNLVGGAGELSWTGPAPPRQAEGSGDNEQPPQVPPPAQGQGLLKVKYWKATENSRASLGMPAAWLRVEVATDLVPF